MRAWEHERSHWRTASGSGTVRHWHFSLWRCRYSIAAPYRQKLPEKDETRILDQLVNCAAGVLDSTWVMEKSGRTLRSSLHFPFAPKPDASAAGWSSSLGRIRHGWGNPLPGWKEGKGRVRKSRTRTSLIAFLALFLVILVIDCPVLEPPVLDAIHGVDARSVVLDG